MTGRSKRQQVMAAGATLAVHVLAACGATSGSGSVPGSGSEPARAEAPVAAGLPTDPTRPDRPATYEICPEIDTVVGPGWELVDRELPAVEAGVMGRRYTFRPIDGASGPTGRPASAGQEERQQIEVATGVEVLELYEDLDFTTETFDLEGNEATLAAAGAFGTGDTLVVLSWSQPAMTAPCDTLTVIGTNVERAELTELARLLARTVAVDRP